MSRSIKKGVYTDEKLMKKVAKALETGSRTVIKTWARDSVIVPDMVGLTFAVHNGKKFENVSPVVESLSPTIAPISPALNSLTSSR